MQAQSGRQPLVLRCDIIGTAGGLLHGLRRLWCARNFISRNKF
jgi:hypothetical protein